ncbi:hypothetical protein Nepgr_029538 [Nepenthes gracilis]|uniref:La-related protein 6A n=1 Tax=Nepenthes gracilis TaxID=150966 RepID=A0AAD3TCN7_NEPGR|nr:hypothetical protein Nepgr_029538 [Nepenthes gracilis]
MEAEAIASASALDEPGVVSIQCDDNADPQVDSLPSDDGGGEDHPPQTQTDGSTESSEYLRAKIIKQVEYYFSDENLPSDKFLMNQIKRDKEGFVSIAFIASFRKMQKLTKDISLIVDALKESSQLVLSSDGKKVKRLIPPLFCEIKTERKNEVKAEQKKKNSEAMDPNLCAVVIENLPEDHSKENIQRMFGEVGNIKSICICDHAYEYSKQMTKIEKLLSGKMHAVVEYETVEAAEKAVATLNNENDWRNGLRVQLLCKRLGYGSDRKARRRSNSEKSTHAQVHDAGGVEVSPNSSDQCTDSHGDEDGEHMPNDTSERKGWNPRCRGQKHQIGNGAKASGIGEAAKQPPGPRMPDGTRGFTMGRGRPPVSSRIL